MDSLSDLSDLLRPHILGLKPYSSARDEYSGTEGVFLDANENPYAEQAGGYNRYPDPYQTQVKQLLAPIKGVRPSQIFLGNGSDEAIDLLIRAFCEPGRDNVIVLPPTYGMYEVSARVNDVQVREVPLTPVHFQLDVSEVLAATDEHTKILFVCSPNNPTGNAIDAADILYLLQHFPGLVVVDEAYIDFSSQPSFLEKIDAFPRLLVMQTFSKAWGLAGLRLGMAFASEELIGILNKIKPPYNISQPAQERLQEVLQKPERMHAMVRQTLWERDSLRDRLQQLPAVKWIYPSDANFLLVCVPDADAVYKALTERHIIVRNRSGVLHCQGCLRITVGTAEENDALMEALSEVLSVMA